MHYTLQSRKRQNGFFPLDRVEAKKSWVRRVVKGKKRQTKENLLPHPLVLVLQKGFSHVWG
jgi:hypothetical protein